MYPLRSIEGLLFRSYLSNYNLSLLHKCIRSHWEEYDNDLFYKSSQAGSAADFKKRIDTARSKTEETINAYSKSNTTILPYFDARYPSCLSILKDFPPLLFVLGNLQAGNAAAVVGSRSVSPLAKDKVENIVRQLVQHKYDVVSGLALGIDTLAHEAAVKYNGYTIAVLPTAIDQLYPPENRELADQILESGGALISEQAQGMTPVASSFVLRNRIQAALSEYVIPVEMHKDSGTDHTVKYAFRYGKKTVVCLPGPNELDHYLPYYEGIIIGLRKWRNKSGNNLVVLKGWKELGNVFSMNRAIQQRLFSSGKLGDG